MVEDYNDIDLMALFARFVSKGKVILKWVGIAAAFGIIVAFSIPKTFVVKSRLAPEIVQKSNNMNSLAALAGINMNSIQMTDAMYPDLYPEIVKSIPFRIELFSMPVKFTYLDESVETDLYDYLLHYTKKPWWQQVAKMPSKALAWFISLFRGKTEPKLGYDDIDAYHLTNEQNRAIHALADAILVEVDKKTFVITVSAITQDPKISADLCSLVIENLKKYIVSYRTEKARHDLAYYQQLNDSAKSEYYAAQQKYARYVDANQSVVLHRILIERERLQQETNLKYSLYNATSQQVQQATAKVQLETPVFATLQPPTVPLAPSAPSKAKIIVVFMFLGFVLGTFWHMWLKDFGKSIRKKVNQSEFDSEVQRDEDNLN